MPIDTLVDKLQAITGSNPDAVLYVRGDKDINYGRVLEVMSLVSAAGFRKVSLVAEAPKGGAARGGRACRRRPSAERAGRRAAMSVTDDRARRW